MQAQWDIIVIGAGPSGMGAAMTAAKIGLQVLVVDEQPSPGGQIYKNITSGRAGERFHKDEFCEGSAMVKGFFNQENIQYCPNTVVWFIEPGRILCSVQGEKKEFKGLHIVVATGAMERPVPFRGWTLPGVMTAGSADLLLKSSGILPKGPVAIAGNGPLIEKIRMTLCRKGIDIAVVADMGEPVQKALALYHIPKALKDLPFLMKGAMMKKENLFSKTRTLPRVSQIHAQGNGRLESVLVSSKNGRARRYRASTLLYHHGVIPRTGYCRQPEHSVQLGCPAAVLVPPYRPVRGHQCSRCPCGRRRCLCSRGGGRGLQGRAGSPGNCPSDGVHLPG